MTDFAQFSAINTRASIDKENGVIRGVSVITIGESAGHNAGTFIDKTTLSQIHDVASKFPDGIKVKLSQSKEHDGSAGQIVGVLKNFRTEGNHERADLHLLKHDENFNKIIEMSQTMPSEFGLSIVIPKSHEKVDGKEYLRCKDIYSIDLVESPAANPNGLFSQNNTNTTMSAIKYKNGTDGEHHADCECKECMSKHSSKKMSAMFASFVGLPETATEDEIKAKFAEGFKSGDVTALSTKITEAQTKLASLEKASANALALSQKAEIDNLIAEAARDGKVVPFDNDDLYMSADGNLTIKMLPSQLAKVINKLPKDTIKMSRKPIVEPLDAEGKAITDANARRQFFSSRREAGANALTEHMRRQSTTTLN